MGRGNRELTPQDRVRRILKSHLDEFQSRSPSYSLRAFARRLQVSPSVLSEVLNGKRNVSLKLAERVCERLSLPPEESQSLREAFHRKKRSAVATKAKPFALLDMDQFHLIGDWYYFAILSLADTDDFVGEEQWIAKRLGLNKNIVKQALIRLERLGLLARDAQGELRATGKQFTTTTDIANLSLRKHHYQNLELAKASLDKDALELRDFSFVTMAIDPADLPTIKERLKAFRRSLIAEFESGRRKEVYKLCLQLFPLSKSEES